MDNRCLKIKDDSQNRKLHYEIMRIIAAFFVIFNHTGSNGFSFFRYKQKGVCIFGRICFCPFFVNFRFLYSWLFLVR